MSCLWRTPDNPGGSAQADRLMELAIDGLRPPARSDEDGFPR
ncbi:hypothetical protein ACFV9P_00205 [Streptomyces sp. NPDC059892]